MSFDDKKISEIIKSFKGYFGKFDRNNVIAHVLAESAESKYKYSISEKDKNSEDIQELIDAVISSIGGATMMHQASNQITEGSVESTSEEKGILTIIDEFFAKNPNDSDLSPLTKAFKDGEFVRICTNKPVLPKPSLENIIHPFPSENTKLSKVKEVTINDVLGTLADDKYVLDGEPSRHNPGISIIDLARPEMARTTNNASIAALWAAGIPSIELSQCVPYLDIKFYDPSIEAVIAEQGTLGFNPSVAKFILGGRKVLNEEEYNFASSTLADPIKMHSGFDENQKADIPSVAGMEMFTMPQTYQGKREPYVDLNPEGMPNSNRPNSVLHPFRPFLTLNSFDVTVESANTILCFMHGTLSMTLGDRSRLHEVAALIKPDRMNHLEIVAEWGWSHPNQENLYGKLLNASRQKRKFIITTADFTFNTDGTVAITMKIAARGAERITKGLMSQVGATEIKKITELISNLRDKVSSLEKHDIQVSKAIFGNDDYMGLFTTVDNVLTIDKKTMKTIQKKLTKAQRSKNADTDFAAIRELLISSTENKEGDSILENVVSYKQAVTDSFASLSKALKDKNKDIGGSNEVIVDPWALKWEYPVCKQYMDNVYSYKKNDDDRISRRDYVSLGRLIMLFVGTALVDNEMWDDIQIMFYGFNDNSYGLHNLQISEFPIPVEEFETAFTNWREDKRNPSLLQFISWVTRTFISRKDNPAWGLTKAFKRKKNEAGQYITERETKSEKEFKQRIQTASNLIYGEGTMMKIKSPSIRVDVETLESTGSKKRSIFRMHIYDAAQDTYRGYTQIMKAMQNTASGLIAKAPEKSSMKGGAKSPSVESMKEINKVLEKALGLGLLKEVSHDKRMENPSGDPDHENHITNTKLYKISAAPGQIKYFISSNMPTLKYGTDGSVIKTAAISKTSDPQYAMIQMQKRNMGSGPKVPTSLETGDFPMRINPVSLTLETIGCPFFRHGQMFFFDFQTNTDVDNAYMLTGINHKISDSDYSTSLQLTSIDRYGVIENLNDQLAELDIMFLEAAKNKKEADERAKQLQKNRSAAAKRRAKQQAEAQKKAAAHRKALDAQRAALGIE